MFILIFSPNLALELAISQPKQDHLEEHTMAEQTKRKPAPKRKTAAKRKTTAKRKPAPRKAAPRKAAPSKPAAQKTAEDFAARAQETSRNAFLAGLGFYGKAYDQAHEQFSSLQGQLETRRKQANKLYKELVKRGTKVEKDAKDALDDFELPFELDGLTDRKKLEAQLDKARARFEELKANVGLKTAA
ncbi:MAG: hypothetical protein AAGA91_05470 [Pseudomonadota bacterium]